MFCFILICAYIIQTNCRDDVKHIGSHKFKFNDEILEINQNLINNKPVPIQQFKPRANYDKAEHLFKRATLLRTHKKDYTRTQSIGYTPDDYPNPITNPQLCVHTFYTKTYICDPDGILSELEQEKINQKLTKSQKRIFVALSHNILVESGKEKQLSQLDFGTELLKKYSESSHSEYQDSILLSYVEELQQLKIILGDKLVNNPFNGEFITQLENEFNEKQKETYHSLDYVIDKINARFKDGIRGYVIFVCALLVLILMTIWGWHTLSDEHLDET